MSRYIFTNKLFIGGIVFLIVFAVVCVLWYQHDTAPDRQAETEAEEQLRQWEASQKVDTEAPTEQETESQKTDPVQTDQMVAETAGTLSETIPSISFNKPAEVRYSPHGFGPYPEVSKEYFLQKGPTPWQMVDLFGSHAPSRNIELISRVLIKLWKEGDTQWEGAGIQPNGKVYVIYPNQVYIRYSPLTNLNGKVQKNPDGTPQKYISMWLSAADIPEPSTEQLLDNDMPGGLEIIDLDVEDPGIEPYSFLGLDN